MAALDFPTSPSNGQSYTLNGITYQYDSTGGTWKSVTATTALSASFMGCRAYNSTTQSIPNATFTALTFNTEYYDTNAIHDTSSNTSRFTVPVGGAGKWAGFATGAFASDSTSLRAMKWRLNGTDVPGVEHKLSAVSYSGTGYLSMALPPIALNEGDYLEVFVYQDSGGSLNIGSASQDSAAATVTFWKIDGVVGPQGSGMNKGTSFPSSPNDGDTFFRSDLSLLCFYKASAAKWLTVNEYSSPMQTLNTQPYSATQTGALQVVADSAQAGVWVERAVYRTYVVTTSSGTQFWTMQTASFSAADVGTNVGSSFTTASDSANTNVIHTVTVGAQMTANDKYFNVSATKTSTAGNLYLNGTIIYRLIVT